MNILYLFGICFESARAEDPSEFFHLQEDFRKRVIGSVAQTISDLSVQKNYVILEGEKDEEVGMIEEIFFIEFRKEFNLIRHVPESRSTPLEYKSNYLKFTEDFTSLESILDKMTEFVRSKCKKGSMAVVYFTMNDTLVGDVLSETDLQKVEDTKERIMTKLLETFSQYDCKVEFFNYKLQDYAYGMIDVNTSYFKSNDEGFMKSTCDKDLRNDDTVVVWNGVEMIVFFLNGKFYSKIDGVLSRLTEGNSGEEENQEVFLSSFLGEIPSYSLEDITSQVKKQFGLYHIVLKFILSINTLEKDLLEVSKDFWDGELLDKLKGIANTFPKKEKAKFEALNVTKDNGKLMESILQCLKVITSKKQAGDDEAYVVASFLKFVCSDENLSKKILLKESNKSQDILLKAIKKKVKEDLVRFVRNWLKGFAEYSHQSSFTPRNKDYKNLLLILNKTEFINPSRVENDLPYWVFVQLCVEVQCASECEQAQVNPLDGVDTDFCF